MSHGFVTVDGTGLVDPEGRPLLLRGVNLGGWLLMEGFINGHPSTETVIRRRLRKVIGDDLYERFFECFYETWYAGEDARFLASLGFDCVRIPVNYRHFEDDDRPLELRPNAFVQLDRAIELNAQHGLYSIIDLHAAQGFQNHDWHSDNPGPRPFLWEQRQFQDRVVWLWEQIAAHYRDAPWVAGYNLLNEPADEGGLRVDALYRRLAQAIRRIDPAHVLFLDGNTYSREFDAFGEPIANAVYALHQYPDPGRAGGGPYPGETDGAYWDRDAVERQFLARAAYMKAHGSPIYVGEFGPVYEGDPTIDAGRLRLLDDQLAIYDAHAASWTIWTYKDVGVHALMEVDPESPWRRRVGPVVDKARRIGARYWGVAPSVPRASYGQVFDLVAREFPGVAHYPFGPERHIWSVVGEKLLGEYLAIEFAEAFQGVSEAELDDLADSFRFARCRPRTALIERVAKAARA